MAMPAAAPAGGAGDVSAGKLVFRKCQACHSLQPGRNVVGPSLAGVIGRKSGTESGFVYSEAMKNANITWTPTTLATYLAARSSGRRVPGAAAATR